MLLNIPPSQQTERKAALPNLLLSGHRVPRTKGEKLAQTLRLAIPPFLTICYWYQNRYAEAASEHYERHI